ncbi:hypothetical protein [Agaribacterium sp. ZY112]
MDLTASIALASARCELVEQRDKAEATLSEFEDNADFESQDFTGK